MKAIKKNAERQNEEKLKKRKRKAKFVVLSVRLPPPFSLSFSHSFRFLLTTEKTIGKPSRRFPIISVLLKYLRVWQKGTSFRVDRDLFRSLSNEPRLPWGSPPFCFLLRPPTLPLPPNTNSLSRAPFPRALAPLRRPFHQGTEKVPARGKRKPEKKGGIATPSFPCLRARVRHEGAYRFGGKSADDSRPLDARFV